MSIEKFSVKYKTSTKLVYVQNHADIYNEIKKVYQSTIPDNFNLKYEDKEFRLVDLDSPIQLHDRKNNILYVEEPSDQFHKSPEDITDNPEKSLIYEESCDSSV